MMEAEKLGQGRGREASGPRVTQGDREEGPEASRAALIVLKTL